jgi:hypothetical protein
MRRFLIFPLLLVLMMANGYSQTGATSGKKKPKYRKVVGISDPFPLIDKKRQMRWFVKWTVNDKLSDWYMREFMTLLKEERDPWKKALDREQFSEKPRERYLKYYKTHVTWYDDVHACIDSLNKNKSAIHPIKESIQPTYVKKRKTLERKNREIIVKFRNTVSKRPKIAKKGK